MNQYNLLTHITKRMETLYFHCPWRIHWSSENYYAELIFQFETLSSNFFNVDSRDKGQHTRYYEYKVLFYDPENVTVLPNHYLYMLPIEANKGILIGEINSLLDYLKYLMHLVRIAQFDDQKEPTAIHWDQSEFERFKSKKMEFYRFNDERLFFPN